MQTGRKILNLRCDRKISQQDLAKACDITPSALSKIEAGINSPRAQIIWRIAKQLGVTVEYLLDEEMPYPYHGYTYRQDLFARNLDPKSTVKMEVTREERAFIDALRKSNHVAREIAVAIPELSIENLRLIHFLIHHAKVQNPSPTFLNQFERLLAGSEKRPAAAVSAGDGGSRRGARRKGR